MRDLLPRLSDYAGLRDSWRADLFAGVTVGIVALPLALAFGISSGTGAAAGLVTAIVAGVIAAVFGGSNVQVSGPTGAMVVILAPIVAAHGVGAVALVSVLAGVLVIVAGVLRLGRLINIVPWPVIEGFTAGIAVIIFLQQVPSAVGAVAEIGQKAPVAAFASVRDMTWSAAAGPLLMVAVVAAVMIAGQRWTPKAPASLIAVVATTAIAEIAGLDVARIGALPDSLPALSFPGVDPALVRSLIGPALAVALLAAIESLLSAKVASTMADTGPVLPDRELVGQGLASVGAGLFGGMPATGAIARTAVNVNAGARTRVAAIVHTLVLVVVVYAASRVVGRIPLAALAGVLMVVTARMIDRQAVVALFRSSRAGMLIFALTAIVTVAFDLIDAIQIGVVVAAIFALRSLAQTGQATREPIPGPERDGDDRIALVRLDGSVFFGAADRVAEQVQDVRDVDVVILRMSHLTMLDATGARRLSELITTLERRGITVLVKGIQERHRTLAAQTGVLDALRHQNHLFDDLDAAVAHARSHVGHGGG